MKKYLPILPLLLLLASCSGIPPVKYQVWYDWPERYLPDFSTLGGPALAGAKENLDLSGLDDSKDHFCVLFETTLKVPADEEYNFVLTTDDGSRLYIDGELLIVNDGAHGPIEKKASKPLCKGRHDIRIEYFDFDKGQSLIFRYGTPTIHSREFNPSAYYRDDRITSRKRFVKPQVREAYTRYAAWKGDDATLVFPILTDVHTARRFSYKHIGYGITAAKMFGADFMVNLGDIGLNAYPATVDAEYAGWILKNTREQMDKYDGVWIYAPGNHDWDAGEGRYHSEQELQDLFQKPWEDRAGGNLHLVPGRTYGYYDVPDKGFRIIFLNSSTTRTIGDDYYLFGEEEVAWLADLLEQTPADTQVIVLSHYMPHPMGRWTTSHPTPGTQKANDALMGLLSEYAQKRTIVAMITGDSHTNDYARCDGVNYFVTQGYGSCTTAWMLPSNRHAFFDYRQNLCIDMIAVKPSSREVHTFRIGAGGAEFDQVFGY